MGIRTMTTSETCKLEEKELALEKALLSRTFARSEQLKAFLRFICESEVRRPGAPLTEYVIGVEVLGRHEGYSPAEDSSVRTRAYELRQKLDRLYATELTDEDVQIRIPKGTYAPQYVQRPALHEVQVVTLSLPAEEGKEQKVTVRPPLRKSLWTLIGAVVVSALVASSVTWFAAKSTGRKAEPDPVLTEAWGPLAEHDGTVILCAATPLSLVAGPADHDVYNSRSYPAPLEAYALFKQHRFLPADGRLGLTFSDNMIGIGALNAALTASKTLRSFGTSYQLLPERVATVSSLRGRNAILFGSAVDSEAISVAMRDVPLTVDFEPSIREFVIRDKSNGSFTAPKKDANGEPTEVFGLLTVKSARDADRKRIESVVFSGITSVGLQGTAEFFSSSSAMGAFRAMLAKEGISGFPAVYQVVIRCTYTNLLLLSFDYYSHRIVRKSL